MLHAFNQKNVRRVLLRGGDEHTIEKTEDAITSMVFSPIAFMSPPDALRCMLALLGPHLSKHTPADEVTEHEVHFWPGGLSAAGWRDDTPTRCEPDLVVIFHFANRASVAVIGEMKWDWRMPLDELACELRRERVAVRQMTDAVQVQFGLAKYPPARNVGSVPVFSWIEVASRLGRLARDYDVKAPRFWAEQVRHFLELADIKAFRGFGTAPLNHEWHADISFWKYRNHKTAFRGFNRDCIDASRLEQAAFWSSPRG